MTWLQRRHLNNPQIAGNAVTRVKTKIDLLIQRVEVKRTKKNKMKLPVVVNLTKT